MRRGKPVYLDARLVVIGYVRVPHPDEEVRRAEEGVCGYVEVLEDYTEGLRGLEGFSHVLLLAYMHKVGEEQRGALVVRPKRLASLGVPLDELPELGVFATDSPHRPNPIALTVARVEGIEGNKIRVCGLDLFDGTPVLDIKPYTPSRTVRDVRVPAWYEDLVRRVEERLGRRVEV